MPSALASVVPAFGPLGRSPDTRLAHVTSRHVVGDLRSGPLRRQTERVVTVDLTIADRALQAHLPLGVPSTVTGPDRDLAALCLERIARLDTDTFKDMLALINVAHAQQSRLIAINVPAEHASATDKPARTTWAALGRHRGWDRLDVCDRRARLGASIDLLMSVRFTFDLHDPHGRRLSNVPLFYNAGLVEQGHNRVGLVLGINELLWATMVEQQRAIIYDRAILAAGPKQDWHFRLYVHLITRLNRSWVTQKLGQHGGRLEMRVESLLDGAGIDYQTQLRAKGPSWLRTRILSVLEGLKAPAWDGRAMLARYTYTFVPDVLNDRVTIWPPAGLVAELNQHRSKSLRAHGGPGGIQAVDTPLDSLPAVETSPSSGREIP